MRPPGLADFSEIEVANVVVGSDISACCDGGMERLRGTGSVPVASYIGTKDVFCVDGVVEPSALNALRVRGNRAGWVSISVVAGMPWVAGHKMNKVSLWKMRIACSPLVDFVANMVGINSTVSESLCDEGKGNTESCKLHAKAEVLRYDNSRTLSYDVRHSYTFIRFERQGRAVSSKFPDVL